MGRSVRDIRARLEDALSKKGLALTDSVWQHLVDHEYVLEVLEAEGDGKREFAALVKVARRELLLEGVAPPPSASSVSNPRRTANTGEYEQLRARAQALCLAHDAVEQGGIDGLGEWRRRHLPDGKPLSPVEARAFCSSPALAALPRREFRTRGIPLVGHRATTLRPRSWWAHGSQPVQEAQITLRVQFDGREETVKVDARRTRLDHAQFTPAAPYGDRYSFPALLIPKSERMEEASDSPALGAPQLYENAFTAAPEIADGSVLYSLWKLTHWLRYLYPWPDGAEVTWFILTGEVPPVAPIEWWPEDAGCQARLCLSVQPWVSSAAVLRAYQEAQRGLVGHSNRPIRARALNLASFVAERRLREPEVRWAVVRQEWNEAHPEWAYGCAPDGLQQMMRDESRARRALMRTARPAWYGRRRARIGGEGEQGTGNAGIKKGDTR